MIQFDFSVLWDELDKVDGKWSKIFPYLLDCNYTLPESKRNAVSREILDYYLGPGESISKDNFKKFSQVCNFN